jgi:transcriptional regulator with XRE-family HTH domain
MPAMDLRTYRKQRRITLDEMGRAVGVTGVTVHRWETGKARPTLDAVERIEAATAGEVTARDFLRAPAAEAAA